MAKPNSARRSEYTTSFKDLAGKQVHAAKHLACNGLGCDECGGLGFTKTYGANPGEEWSDENPPRVDDEGVQRLKAAKERG